MLHIGEKLLTWEFLQVEALSRWFLNNCIVWLVGWHISLLDY